MTMTTVCSTLICLLLKLLKWVCGPVNVININSFVDCVVFFKKSFYFITNKKTQKPCPYKQQTQHYTFLPSKNLPLKKPFLLGYVRIFITNLQAHSFVI